MQFLNKCVEVSNTRDVQVSTGTQGSVRTTKGSVYLPTRIKTLVPWGSSGQKVKLPTMLSLMTWLCTRGAIPQLSNVPS